MTEDGAMHFACCALRAKEVKGQSLRGKAKMKMVVSVRDDRVEIGVDQRSKAVWTASGKYNGKYHEAKGSSAASAAKWWADAAKYHSN